MFEKLADYAATTLFNPEALLGAHFAKRPDIKIFMEDKRAFFVRRPHMENYTIVQCMEEHPGQNKWLNPDVVQTHAEVFRAWHGEAGEKHVEQFAQAQLSQLRNTSP